MELAVKDDEMRMAAVKLLEGKGYAVKNTASGSGVPRFSRIEIEKDGEKLVCAIKLTTKGRISFNREEDGTYAVLSDSDRVIHVQRFAEDSAVIHITMFNKETVVEAFEANHKAKVERGMEHIPSWVNPQYEEGWRFTGSGFKDEAIWSETVLVNADGTISPATAASTGPKPSTRSFEPGIMERIKAMLAEHMGVRPEQLEVDVRVKI